MSPDNHNEEWFSLLEASNPIYDDEELDALYANSNDAVFESVSISSVKVGEVYHAGLPFFNFADDEKYRWGIIIDLENNDLRFLMCSSVEEDKKSKKRAQEIEYNHTIENWHKYGFTRKSFSCGSVFFPLTEIKFKRKMGMMSKDEYEQCMEGVRLFLREKFKTPWTFMNWMKNEVVKTTIGPNGNNNLNPIQSLEDIEKSKRVNCVDIALAVYEICKRSQNSDKKCFGEIAWMKFLYKNSNSSFGHLFAFWKYHNRYYALRFITEQDKHPSGEIISYFNTKPDEIVRKEMDFFRPRVEKIVGEKTEPTYWIFDQDDNAEVEASISDKRLQHNLLKYVNDSHEFIHLDGSNSLFFFHMVPKGTDVSKGLLAPAAMNKFGMKEELKKSLDKYRERMVKGWRIYPGKLPEELSETELIQGLEKFRGEGGSRTIYFFRYPPTENLGKNMSDILKEKDIYRIDLNNPRLQKYIEQINWGYYNSNTDNKAYTRDYYENISEDDYFSEYNDNPTDNAPLFAPIPHIGIVFKDGICPREFLTLVTKASDVAVESVTTEMLPGDVVPGHPTRIFVKDLGDGSYCFDDTQVGMRMRTLNDKERGYTTDNLEANFASYRPVTIDIVDENVVEEAYQYIDKKLTYADVKKDMEFIYDDDGIANGVYVIDGQQYRVRVETIVKREVNGTSCVFFEKKKEISHYGSMYKLPGGSVEPDKSLAEQAECEVNEEILAKVKNVHYTGKYYIVKYDPKTIPEWHKRILWPIGLKYVGAITFVFTADYDGPYKKKVAKVDQDSLAQKGDWYPIWEFEEIKADIHQGIALESMEAVEESLTKRGNIIPVDYSEYDGIDTRIMCLNTHCMNGIEMMLPWVAGFTLIGEPFLGTLIDCTAFMAYGLSDQIFAVDIFAVDKNINIRNDCEGLPIIATNDGTVVDCVNDVNDELGDFDKMIRKYGNFVVISHDNGKWFSVYAHLAKGSVTVKPGNKVHRGQKIAELGHSGNSDAKASHLHFEMLWTNVMAKNRPSLLLDLPKTLSGFGQYECTKIPWSTAAKIWIPFNKLKGLKQAYKEPMQLNNSGELSGACFLTETPAKEVEEVYIPIMESSKQFKSSKAKNFEEFCNECKTPEDAMNWFIANKVIWNDKANDDKMRWPDTLVRERKGNCLDQSVMMHFFFKKRHIEHRMALFTIRLENGTTAGHIFPLFKRGKYVYAWLYIGPGHGVITGPYKSWYDAAGQVTEFYKVLILSSPKKGFEAPVSDSTEWSVQEYKETEHLDKYLNKDIVQKDYLYADGGDNLWSTHFFSRDFRFIRIPKITGVLYKLLAWSKQYQTPKEKKVAKEALELIKSDHEVVKESVESPEVVKDENVDSTPMMGICDHVLHYLGDSIDIQKFADIKSGRRFMYTRCKIMKKDIPLVLLLSYCEGLTTVLRKAEIKFQFSDTRPRLKEMEAVRKGVIPFSDGYLVYDKFPLEVSLLMNGFGMVDTRGFEYAEMDTKDVYVSLFDVLFGTRMLANALDNFYDWMIDPVTFQVLEDLNYPTDFVGLLLAGNKLLADNSYTSELDMRNYRIRSNEMAYAYAFKAISEAYGKYRMTSGNKNPTKISIPQGTIIKDIMQSQVVEDVSELSPIVEVEKSHLLTDKGPSGTNLKEAYTMKRRCYDKSMVGVIAIPQSPDANVGITKTLTINPNVVNGRGYVKPSDERDLDDSNIFSMAEMLTPGLNRDDQIRVSMSVKQSKHIIPVEHASPVLISNGAEKVLPYHLSTDFCIVAKDDGKVISRDEKTGVIVIEYKNLQGKAKRQVINANSKIVKNGAGGFYLPSKMNTDALRPGTYFKKNSVLAYNERYFSSSPAEGVRFNIGTLTKVACMATYTSFEDGNFVTDKLSKKLGTEVCMEAEAIVGMNSNVDYIVKVGQQVNVNDPLIIYDNSSQDASFNKMLANIGKELKEEITLMGKIPVKSKYAGVVEDIKIYTTVEPKELSPSLRKIVDAYFARLRAQEAEIKKRGGDVNGLEFSEKAVVIDGGEDGKIMGVKVHLGVLIKFFIKYKDYLDVGDKLVHFTAMKYVNGELIAKGQEPYSIDRPDEEISSTFAPAGVLARMTPSIFCTMYGNKVIVELKRRWLEMYQKDNPSFKPKDDLY